MIIINLFSVAIDNICLFIFWKEEKVPWNFVIAQLYLLLLFFLIKYTRFSKASEYSKEKLICPCYLQPQSNTDCLKGWTL